MATRSEALQRRKLQHQNSSSLDNSVVYGLDLIPSFDKVRASVDKLHDLSIHLRRGSTAMQEPKSADVVPTVSFEEAIGKIDQAMGHVGSISLSPIQAYEEDDDDPFRNFAVDLPEGLGLSLSPPAEEMHEAGEEYENWSPEDWLHQIDDAQFAFDTAYEDALYDPYEPDAPDEPEDSLFVHSYSRVTKPKDKKKGAKDKDKKKAGKKANQSQEELEETKSLDEQKAEEEEKRRHLEEKRKKHYQVLNVNAAVKTLDDVMSEEPRAFVEGNTVMASRVRLPQKLLRTLSSGESLLSRKRQGPSVGEQWASYDISKSESKRGGAGDGSRGAIDAPSKKVLPRPNSGHIVYELGYPEHEKRKPEVGYVSGRRIGNTDWDHSVVGSLRHATYGMISKQRRPRQTTALLDDPPRARHTRHPLDSSVEENAVRIRWGDDVRNKGTRLIHQSLYSQQTTVPKAKTGLSQDLKFKFRSKLMAAAYTGHRGMELEVLFQRIDKDGGGSLSLDEFVHGVRQVFKIGPSQISDEELENFYDYLDADGSGSLSLQELQDFMKANTKQKEQEEPTEAEAMQQVIEETLAEETKKEAQPSERLRMMQDKYEKKRIMDRLAWLQHDEVHQRWPIGTERRPPPRNKLASPQPPKQQPPKQQPQQQEDSSRVLPGGSKSGVDSTRPVLLPQGSFSNPGQAQTQTFEEPESKTIRSNWKTAGVVKNVGVLSQRKNVVDGDADASASLPKQSARAIASATET